MKFLIVCAFLALAVSNIRAEISKEEAIAMATECKEEAGASDADFEDMVKHKPAQSKEGKCMRACALKKFGVLSADGKMIKDTSIKFAKIFIKAEEKKDLATEIIEACEDLDVSDDHCEAAEEYGHCVKTEFESHGLVATEELI